MPETRLLLIRHAESTWNAAGRWQGRGDPPLSARGRQQAARLAKGLADLELDTLVASDLRRATETAGFVARALGLQVQADARLREHDVGTWTGRTRAQIAAADGELLLRFRSARDVRPPGGETLDEVRERAIAAIAAIADAHPGRRVAVVTHKGVSRALVPGLDLGNTEWHWVGASVLRELSLPEMSRVAARPSAR